MQVLERYSNSSDLGERLETLLQFYDEPAQKPRTKAARRVCRQLPLEEVVQLVKAYADGETIAKITARFHVDQTTVQKHVRAAGLPRRVNRITARQVERAVKLYRSGCSVYFIAGELALGYGTVQRALVKAGVDLDGSIRSAGEQRGVDLNVRCP